VRRIRILLAGMPRMLLDMLTDIVSVQPEMMVTGKMQETTDINSAVRKARADLVILRERAGRQRQNYSKLLRSRPHLRVLSITSDGHRFFLHELRPFRTALGEISPESLVQAIHSSAQLRARLNGQS
jgi:DNA-binding NarL/FixJ family response regulator